MSRTIRKDKFDKKYSEGQTRQAAYRCRCFYCTGKPKSTGNAHLKEFKKELKEILGYSSVVEHLTDN